MECLEPRNYSRAVVCNVPSELWVLTTRWARLGERNGLTDVRTVQNAVPSRRPGDVPEPRPTKIFILLISSRRSLGPPAGPWAEMNLDGFQLGEFFDREPAEFSA